VKVHVRERERDFLPPQKMKKIKENVREQKLMSATATALLFSIGQKLRKRKLESILFQTGPQRYTEYL